MLNILSWKCFVLAWDNYSKNTSLVFQVWWLRLETRICFDDEFFCFACLVTCGVAAPAQTWAGASLNCWCVWWRLRDGSHVCCGPPAEPWWCRAARNGPTSDWIQRWSAWRPWGLHQFSCASLERVAELLCLLTTVTWHWTRVPQNILTITSMCHKCLNVVISALLGPRFVNKTQIRRQTDVSVSWGCWSSTQGHIFARSPSGTWTWARLESSGCHVPAKICDLAVGLKGQREDNHWQSWSEP